MDFLLEKLKKYRLLCFAIVICGLVLTFFKDTINKTIQTYISNTNSERLANEPLFDTSSTGLKILLLPLHPDDKCLIQNTDYEGKIIQHFEDIKKRNKNSLISCKFEKYKPCPQNDEEAIEIGEKNNASMVIWGAYDTNIKRTKIRIRNNLISQKLKEWFPEYRNNYDSDYRLLMDLDLLRKGYLQENADYIIDFIHVINYLFFEKDMAKAIEYCQAYDSTDSAYYDINILKASALYHYGDTANAINLLSMLIKACPLDFRGYQNRATYYRDQGNYNGAFTDINKVLLLRPGEYLPYSLRGSCYFMAGNYVDARNDFLKSLAINENNFYTYYNLAQAYWFLNNYDSCERACLKCLLLNPYSSYTNALCAKATARLKKYSEADAHFQLALSTGYNDDEDEYLYLAKIALENRDSNDAMVLYSKSKYYKKLQ